MERRKERMEGGRGEERKSDRGRKNRRKRKE
jgi:hypothetical protein